MKFKVSFYLILFFLCGTAIGLWLGQKTMVDDHPCLSCRPATQGELNHFYSDVLNISDKQRVKLIAIEKSYQGTRDTFTARMHTANLQLAEVLEKEGYESTKIEPLVAEIHLAMGKLQALSLNHLAAIEKVLEPKQAALLKQNAVERLRQN